MNSDHYKTLGVSESASRDEIMSVWRKLVRENHPDRNSSTKATGKFREVSEAWAILGNADSRKKYDLIRNSKPINPKQSVPGEFYSRNDGYGNPQTTTRETKDHVLREILTVMVDVKDVYAKDTIAEIKELIPENCSFCRSEGYVSHTWAGRLSFTTCPSCRGTGMVYDNTVIRTKLPVGVVDGSIVKLRHPSGYIVRVSVKFKQNRMYKTDGYDLCIDRKFSAAKLVKGTTCTVKLPDNKTLKIQVPKNTKVGTWLRIPDKGIPQTTHERGNLKIKICLS